MKTVYTAIFGSYDELKEPKVKTPGWTYLCFTDQPFKSDTWQIRKVCSVDAWKSARIYKILYRSPSKSIYIDGSFIINCDLDEFYAKHHKPGKISFPKHPIRNCVYEEIKACTVLKKDDKNRLRIAEQKIFDYGIKPNFGLAACGIIIRDGSNRRFCEDWFQSIDLCNRDQIAWAVANYNNPGSVNLFDYDYRTGKDFLHVPHNTNPEKQQTRLNHYKSVGLI